MDKVCQKVIIKMDTKYIWNIKKLANHPQQSSLYSKFSSLFNTLSFNREKFIEIHESHLVYTTNIVFIMQ